MITGSVLIQDYFKRHRPPEADSWRALTFSNTNPIKNTKIKYSVLPKLRVTAPNFIYILGHVTYIFWCCFCLMYLKKVHVGERIPETMSEFITKPCIHLYDKIQIFLKLFFLRYTAVFRVEGLLFWEKGKSPHSKHEMLDVAPEGLKCAPAKMSEKSLRFLLCWKNN